VSSSRLFFRLRSIINLAFPVAACPSLKLTICIIIHFLSGSNIVDISLRTVRERSRRLRRCSLDLCRCFALSLSLSRANFITLVTEVEAKLDALVYTARSKGEAESMGAGRVSCFQLFSSVSFFPS